MLLQVGPSSDIQPPVFEASPATPAAVDELLAQLLQLTFVPRPLQNGIGVALTLTGASSEEFGSTNVSKLVLTCVPSAVARNT